MMHRRVQVRIKCAAVCYTKQSDTYRQIARKPSKWNKEKAFLFEYQRKYVVYKDRIS